MSESENGSLSVNGAAEALAAMLDENGNIPINEGSEVKEPIVEEESDAPVEEADEDGAPESTIKIKVDGKEVELTEAELAEAYKNGLRQSDYTKKTMEVSETRKAAEAEYRQAVEQRAEYAQKLQNVQSLLQAQVLEQSQTNWAELLESDPVEYLKQQHLFQQRQAALQQTQAEQQQLYALHQQEQQAAYQRFLTEEQQHLVAKLPSWSNPDVAKAEKAEMRDFLKEAGFSDNDISQVADHRQVLLVRQAMQFAKLMKDAPDAAKRVEKAPLKVERPGNSDRSPTDGRTKAMQRLGKTGKVEDAAAVFASFL